MSEKQKICPLMSAGIDKAVLNDLGDASDIVDSIFVGCVGKRCAWCEVVEGEELCVVTMLPVFLHMIAQK